MELLETMYRYTFRRGIWLNFLDITCSELEQVGVLRDKLWISTPDCWFRWNSITKVGPQIPVEVDILVYCSFKIFPGVWLVRTTRIIHHDQLLLTKFEKKLCHIEPMTSKVQPAADYWTIDRVNLGTRLCNFWWAEKQRAKWWNSFKVPLSSNSRYPFFYVFARNRSFLDILPNFNLLRTLQRAFYGPLFPRI